MFTLNPNPILNKEKKWKGGRDGCWWHWEVVSFCSVLPLIHELLSIGCVRFLFFLLSFCPFEWMRWFFIAIVWDLVVIHSVLDSVVMVALYFLYQVVILLLSWCCALFSSSFVVYWEWGLYSQVVHSDPVGYLESLSTVVKSLNAYDMEPSDDLCRSLQWSSVTEWDLSSSGLILLCWYGWFSE